MSTAGDASQRELASAKIVPASRIEARLSMWVRWYTRWALTSTVGRAGAAGVVAERRRVTGRVGDCGRLTARARDAAFGASTTGVGRGEQESQRDRSSPWIHSSLKAKPF